MWLQGEKIYYGIEQILALRRIIEGIEEKNLSAVITFIDFKKASDTIHRGKMIRILKAYGSTHECKENAIHGV